MRTSGLLLWDHGFNPSRRWQADDQHKHHLTPLWLSWLWGRRSGYFQSTPFLPPNLECFVVHVLDRIRLPFSIPSMTDWRADISWHSGYCKMLSDIFHLWLLWWITSSHCAMDTRESVPILWAFARLQVNGDRAQVEWWITVVSWLKYILRIQVVRNIGIERRTLHLFPIRQKQYFCHSQDSNLRLHNFKPTAVP